MQTLDLHGVKHEDVESQVLDFAWKNETPFKIITGNSRRMKDLVRQVLTRYELAAYEESDYNLGALIVVEPPKKYQLF
tara:strand:- start:602 stop:835 length:234 start_codon:yes stop_codon:yes gene_type:complete